MASNVTYVLDVIDKASADLDRVSSSADNASDSLDDAGRSSETSSKSMAKVATVAKAAAAALAALAVGAGVKVAKGAIELASSLEKTELQLSILTGSSEYAKERLEELFRITVETPFEFEDLVKADLSLTQFGADAEAMLPKIIDLSAALGQDLSQSAFAIGKAFAVGSAGADMLKERMPGVYLEIQRLGGTKGDLEDFQEALLAAIDVEQYAGGAEKLAQTFGGAVSNMKGQYTKFAKEVAEAGLFDTVRGTVIQINEALSQSSVEVGTLAGSVSEALSGGFVMLAHTVVSIAKNALRVRMSIAGWGLIFDHLQAKIAKFSVAFAKLNLRAAEFIPGVSDETIQKHRTALEGLVKREREATAERLKGLDAARAMKREYAALKRLSAAIGGAAISGSAAALAVPSAARAPSGAAGGVAGGVAGGGAPSTAAADAAAALFKTQKALASTLPMAERIAAMYDALTQRATAEGLTDEVRIEFAKLEAMQRKHAEAQIAATEKQRVADEKAAADAARAAQEAAEATRLAWIESAQQIGDALSSVIGGGISGVTSILSMLGPQGAAVGAFVGAFHALGEKGAGAVADDLTGTIDTLLSGVLELPELLLKALPDIIGHLIESLLENAPAIAMALVEAALLLMPTLMSAIITGLYNGIKAMADAILSAVGLGEQGRENVATAGRVALAVGTLGISELIRALTDDGYQTGGYVDRTGLAMVHAGERVTPAGGAPTQTARSMMGGGGGVSLTINTNVVDPNSIPSLVREIERVFGANGRGSSPLFAV